MLSSLRPTLRQRTLLVVALAGAALVARADIAVLREKGPHSGSAFSNPGLVADAPAGLKVAMKTADVKIHLRPGDSDTLKADVTADFEMDDTSPAELAGQLYLVGFPVTGLSSKIVTIDDFKVTVDGKEPAMVLRRAISISRWQIELKDQPINGNLHAQFAPEARSSARRMHPQGMQYADESTYRASYAWQQNAKPGTSTHVRVTYTVSLRAQSIHYSRSDDADEADDEVIPSYDLKIGRWTDHYYFFDYVLRSGSTWDGPIGQESVTLMIDPALGLDPNRVRLNYRNYAALSLPEPEDSAPSSQEIRVQPSADQRHDRVGWLIRNAKPMSDLLIAIPVSAIHRED